MPQANQRGYTWVSIDNSAELVILHAGTRSNIALIHALFFARGNNRFNQRIDSSLIHIPYWLYFSKNIA